MVLVGGRSYAAWWKACLRVCGVAVVPGRCKGLAPELDWLRGVCGGMVICVLMVKMYRLSLCDCRILPLTQ